MRLDALVQWLLPAVGLPRPTFVIGSPDPAVAQALSVLVDAGDELARRYPYSKRLVGGVWLTDAAGAALSAPSADTNVIMFDDDVIRPSIRWRLQDAIGLDYAEAFRQAEEAISRRAASYTRETYGTPSL